MRKIVAVTAVAVCLGVVCGSALAAQQIHKSLTLPAEFAATITAAGCNDIPGPQITLQTQQLNLPGLTAEVIFSNLIGSQSPQDKVKVPQVVFPQNQQVSVPAQSVVGALTHDPFIWLQLTDSAGRPLTSEMFLGRCSQGQFSAAASFDLPVIADADVAATECTSVSGPAVTMDGQAALQPINGKLIFRNTNATVGVPASQIGEASVSVAIVPLGQAYAFPEQAVVAGTGGNPLISVQFRQGSGDPLSAAVRLGRCTTIK